MDKNLLIPFCTYQGGKQRYSKQIVDIILNENHIHDNTKFYDLCCGSGAVTLELINRGIKPYNITMVDKSIWGDFWNIIGSNKFNISAFKKELDLVPDNKELIKDYVKNIANYPLDDLYIYKYIILQCCSFGGKQVDSLDDIWKHNGFRDYWKPTETSIRKSPVNPMQPTKEELFKRIKFITEKCLGVNGIRTDILNVKFQFDENSIIYIDPPYRNTTGYNHVFNVSFFISKLKTKTYVSESTVMSDSFYKLLKSGAKGGINGEKKSRTEEYLNIFN